MVIFTHPIVRAALTPMHYVECASSYDIAFTRYSYTTSLPSVCFSLSTSSALNRRFCTNRCYLQLGFSDSRDYVFLEYGRPFSALQSTTFHHHVAGIFCTRDSNMHCHLKCSVSQYFTIPSLITLQISSPPSLSSVF